ncbi:MAG: hypothetical protein H7222_00945, partial [Methylotenera sp.]|nr:hypothetical protein [Oligoflexia bacterium]
MRNIKTINIADLCALAALFMVGWTQNVHASGHACILSDKQGSHTVQAIDEGYDGDVIDHSTAQYEFEMDFWSNGDGYSYAIKDKK